MVVHQDLFRSPNAAEMRACRAVPNNPAEIVEIDAGTQVVPIDKFLHKGIEDLFESDPTEDKDGVAVGEVTLDGRKVTVILDVLPTPEHLASPKFASERLKRLIRGRQDWKVSKPTTACPPHLTRDDWINDISYYVFHVSRVKFMAEIDDRSMEQRLDWIMDMITWQETQRGCYIPIHTILESFVTWKLLDRLTVGSYLVTKTLNCIFN